MGTPTHFIGQHKDFTEGYTNNSTFWSWVCKLGGICGVFPWQGAFGLHRQNNRLILESAAFQANSPALSRRIEADDKLSDHYSAAAWVLM